jgi:radical SAM superfamily enzyme YgiQ (UPF0313 family)
MFTGILNYEGTLIRPPSEAGSLILQVTLGCSDNGCIFCPAYKDKKFRIKDFPSIEKELQKASRYFPETRRIFFADGDAIIIEQDKLLKILRAAERCFPKLSRISAYGSIKSLENKSVNELAELKKHKLGIVFWGIETGDKEVYQYINKYGTPEGNVEVCRKLKQAQIKVNSTIILGLGGRKYSKQHALNTAKLLNLARPEQIAALTLMIEKGTPIHKMEKEKTFMPLDKFELLEELYLIIKNMTGFKCMFFSNHASNYFPVQARFPNDKDTVLESLEYTIKSNDQSVLMPEWLRGL